MPDSFDRGRDTDATGDPPFKTLTREEAQSLRARHPVMSPWRMIASQAVAGAVCTVVVWVIAQRSGAAWSALYGASAAVLPSALLAHGVTRLTSSNPSAALAGFMFWELVKIVVAAALLVAATRVVPDLSWPALLVTMVVCLKVNWLALLWRRRPVVMSTTQRV